MRLQATFKTIALVGIALAISLPSEHASAKETFVELDLTVGMEVTSHATKYHRTGSLDCNPFGRSPDREALFGDRKNPTSTAGNGRFSDPSIQRVYELKTNYADAHEMIPRSFQVEITNRREGRNLVVELKFRDRQLKSQTNKNEGHCSHTDWSAAASKDSINGKVRIGYRMPKDVWAVKVVRVHADGIFAKQSAQLIGSSSDSLTGMLNADKDPIVTGSKFIAWAQPGTDLFQELQFKNVNEGAEVLGTLRIEFEPIVSKIDSSIATISLDSVRGKLDALEKKKYSEDANIEFVESVVSLLAEPLTLKGAIANSRTSEAYSIVRKLTEIANKAIDAKGFWDSRAASAILAYEIALALLEDFGPYCDVQTVNLPFSGAASISGMRLAYVYLSRAQARLENYKFENYLAYVDQLVRYEKSGLTYSAVRTDQSKLNELQKAFDILKSSVSEITPFAAALSEVNFVLKQFKSVGAGQAATDQIVGTLTELSKVEGQFVRDFILRLRDFKASNHKTVQGIDLLERLEAIVEQQQRVSSLLHHNVRFLGVDREMESNGFVGMLQSLIVNNVLIFEQPLQWSTLERVRAVYRQASRVESAVSQANKCIQ